MEVTNEKTNGIYIIKISGKLDSYTSAEFEKHLISPINSGEKKILIDCSALDYISSAGLRVLLVGARLLKDAGGKIIFTSMKEHIYQIFEIAGFIPLFEIYPSTEDAVKTG
jgi:anti-anti-sigma factor